VAILFTLTEESYSGQKTGNLPPTIMGDFNPKLIQPKIEFSGA
jgi:hypothetical protein